MTQQQQYAVGQKVRLVHCGEDLSGLTGEVMNVDELKAIITSHDDPSLTMKMVEEELQEGKIFVAAPSYDGKDCWPYAFYPEQLTIIEGE